MVLEGRTRGADNKETLNRITWTANDDGTVRQVWASSEDDGQNWRTLFDGLYTRVED